MVLGYWPITGLGAVIGALAGAVAGPVASAAAGVFAGYWAYDLASNAAGSFITIRYVEASVISALNILYLDSGHYLSSSEFAAMGGFKDYLWANYGNTEQFFRFLMAIGAVLSGSALYARFLSYLESFGRNAVLSSYTCQL